MQATTARARGGRLEDGRLGIGVVGAGYWGPQLVRNFASSAEWRLAAVCDDDLSRAYAAAADRPDLLVTADLDDLLVCEEIDAIAVATPAGTHRGIAERALRAGKHVLVEKPLADSVGAGREMVDLASANGLVLMTDHTYCYTPAVQKIRELVVAGHLGDVLFVDSVRINLGLVRPDVDVLWDLASHDLAILDYVLPGGLHPVGVAAQGADPLGALKPCVGYLTLPLAGGAMAHIHVNWLSPTKIRQMVIGGSERTLLWDDLRPQQRLSVYDRGVDLIQQSVDSVDRHTAAVSYRLGDTWAPALEEREALTAMVAEFAAAIREGRAPATDGESGVRVLAVLEAAASSLRARGALVDVARQGPVLEIVR